MPLKGTTAQRGYGLAHQKIRARFAKLVAAGAAVCARCGKPIAPQENWDLDHSDYDRSRYLGASHRRCNRAVASHRARREVAARAKALRFFD